MKRLKKFNEAKDVSGTLAANRFGLPEEFTDFNKKFNTFQNFKNREEIIPYNIKRFSEKLIGTIIKNPKTLTNIGRDVRGVIDKYGNLYVETEELLTHDEMIEKILDKLNFVNYVDEWYINTPTEFVTVQRIYNENLFVIGESYMNFHDVKSKKYKIVEPIFQEFLDKAKIKNPHIKFENIMIDNYIEHRMK